MLQTHNFTYESATLKLKEIDKDVYVLTNLQAKERQKGHASVLLEFMGNIADEKGWTIKLRVQRFGKPPGPDNKTLIGFYRKHGFTHERKNLRSMDMVRTPKKEKENG